MLTLESIVATRRSGRVGFSQMLGLALLCAVGLQPSAVAADHAYAAATAVEPLAVDSPIPEVAVVSVSGKPVDLSEIVREQGALLVFYRGGW